MPATSGSAARDGARLGPWSVLRLRPWSHAPLLLLRRPSVALALAAAAFVAVLPAAAAPLFLSGARSAALHRQLDNTCPSKVAEHVEAGLTFHPGGGSAGSPDRDATPDPQAGRKTYRERVAAATGAAAAAPELVGPTMTLLGVTSLRPAPPAAGQRDHLAGWALRRAGRAPAGGLRPGRAGRVAAGHLRRCAGPAGGRRAVPVHPAADAGPAGRPDRPGRDPGTAARRRDLHRPAFAAAAAVLVPAA